MSLIKAGMIINRLSFLLFPVTVSIKKSRIEI